MVKTSPWHLLSASDLSGYDIYMTDIQHYEFVQGKVVLTYLSRQVQLLTVLNLFMTTIKQYSSSELHITVIHIFL